MRIVTWNCNGAFRKKYQYLAQFDADVFVVQECEDPSSSTAAYKDWAGDFLWTGQNKNKGIGIFPRADNETVKLDWESGSLESFLPCRVNDQFNLVGVWTKNVGKRKDSYVGQLWKYIQLRKNDIGCNNIVVSGDFNSNAIWDHLRRGCNHSDVVREFDKLDIESIYHRDTGERHGFESTPTQYMYRSLDKPYHLDYAFASRVLLVEEKATLIGDANEWLKHSDHLPLAFEIRA